MSLDSMDYNLMLRINRGIQNLGQQAGSGVPLSVYNELLARYREEARNAHSLRENCDLLENDRDRWKDFAQEMDVAFDKLKANRDQWQAYAAGQKARAERAEAQLAQLSGPGVPKAA